MQRRGFIVLAAGGWIPVPLYILAQADAGPPVIGFLGIAAGSSHASDIAGLHRGLEQLGHVVGRTIVIEEYYADGSMERFHTLLDRILDSGARLLVVPGLAAALAVRERAPGMPVVAVGLPSTVIYPDLFASLHRPGGSVTGFSHFGEDLAAKRVDLLREVVPTLTTVAILHNSVDPLYRAWGEKTKDGHGNRGYRPYALVSKPHPGPSWPD